VNYLLAGLCIVIIWKDLVQGEPETSYMQRTDGVEEKLRLLQTAYEAGNRELALSLAASLRETLNFERQVQGAKQGQVVGAETFGRVDVLPKAWAQWAHGWAFYKVLELR